MYEVICCECGDDPAQGYREASAGFRRIRGPYPLMVGVALFLQHVQLHDTAEETTASHPARPDIPRQRQDEQIN